MIFDSIPIRLCNAEHPVMLDDVLGIENHFLGAIGIEHINCDVMFQQFHGPILGQRKHIAVQIPIVAHIVHRQRGVRHWNSLFQLREHGVRVIGDIGCLCGAQIFPADAALLANLRKVPVNVCNQLGGGFVDGFQTGAQLFQLLAL